MTPLRTCFCILLFLSLGGCASYTTIMQHPETGDIEQCQSKGAGLIPMALAKSQHEDCIKQLKGLGYEPVPGSDGAT